MGQNKKENSKTEWVRTPASSRNIVNKHDFRDMVYENLNRRFTREAVNGIIKEVFNCFEEILLDGKTLVIRDSFTMKPRIRKGRHYNTMKNYGCEGYTEDYYIPYFHPHKKLRDACLSLPVDKNTDEDSADE